MQDPPYCDAEFTLSDCNRLDAEIKECKPTAASVYNSIGYHTVTACNGEILSNITDSNAATAVVRNVTGTVTTLYPVMCKDEAACHTIVIDVNNNVLPPAVEITDETIIEYTESKYNISFENDLINENVTRTMTLQELKIRFANETLGTTDGGDGNATNSPDFNELAKGVPSTAGQRECQLIVNVGSSYTLGNLIATLKSGGGSDSSNR